MKKILPFCLLAIGFGFAQDPMGTPPPPAPEASSTGPASFDAVRGHAYNPTEITGAPSSVEDLYLTPSDIYGKKFFYVSPTDKLGYVAFSALGGSTLLGFRSRGDGSNLVLGYATPGFGLALEYAIQKEWTKTTSDNAPLPGTTIASTRVTGRGDNIDLHISLPIGSATAYARAGWDTDLSTYNETEGAPVIPGEPNVNYYVKYDRSTISTDVGVLGEAGNLNYDVNLNILRFGTTITSDEENFSSMGDKVVSRDSYLGVGLNFNLSYAALKNETARILVGSNNGLGVELYDEVDADADGFASGKRTRLYIAPNILGEVILADNWLAFAGARHNIIFRFGAADPGDLRNVDYSETEIYQSATAAYIGLRYQKSNWAFEAQVEDNVFDNPFGGFNGSNIFASFGGFIYF
ncbi:MAG: hypothetical protein LBC64_11500 [Fibromonadaceae bacterium]|nr:hypothetical protein [Fibromonadaceae bacterium]